MLNLLNAQQLHPFTSPPPMCEGSNFSTSTSGLSLDQLSPQARLLTGTGLSQAPSKTSALPGRSPALECGPAPRRRAMERCSLSLREALFWPAWHYMCKENGKSHQHTGWQSPQHLGPQGQQTHKWPRHFGDSP